MACSPAAGAFLSTKNETEVVERLIREEPKRYSEDGGSLKTSFGDWFGDFITNIGF